MIITRDSHERATYRYELEIDDAFVDELNQDLDRMHPDGHPEVTMLMVMAVAQRETATGIKDLDFKVNRWYDLYDWIKDAINNSVWEQKPEAIDGECEDYDDEVDLTGEEQEMWDKFIEESEDN